MRSLAPQWPARSRWTNTARFLCLPLLLALALNAQSNNSIIQHPGDAYAADVQQLESDGVQAFLSVHNLPSTDAPLLYQYGRQDLRDELRAWIYGTLTSVISKPAAARTQHEQNLYNWMEGMVYQNEVAEYASAVGEYTYFKKNECTYTLDPTIASAQNLTYNAESACLPLVTLFSLPNVPSPSYFTAFGIKNSYSVPLTNYSNAPSILLDTYAINQTDVAYAVLPGAAAGAISGALYATETIAPYAFQAFDWTIVGAEATIDAVTAADIAIGSVVVGLGPAGIVVAAVGIGIEAGLQLESQDEIDAGLTTMQNYYNSVAANCNSVDLNAFLTDSTGVGNYKLLTTFLATTLPDVPSTVPLPSRTEGVDPIWGKSVPNGDTSDTMVYTDWEQRRWTASLWGNYIIKYYQPCTLIQAGQTCPVPPQVASFGVTLHGFTISGPNNTAQKISASRIGSNWLVANPGAPSGATFCNAGATGLSPSGSSQNTCKALVESSLNLTSISSFYAGSITEANLSQIWSVITPPTFATNGKAFFMDGTPQSIVLSAQEGDPNYVGQDLLYTLSGRLPPFFETSTSANGLQITYNGNPSSSLAGTYNITASAIIGNDGAAQGATVVGNAPLALTVRPGDAIEVQGNTLTAYVGDTVDYQIQAPGAPNPQFSLVGVPLPPGLRFAQTGNTAAITGVSQGPGAGSGTIETNYGATAPLTVNVAYRQSPAITSPDTWTFADNTPNRFLITLAPIGPPTEPNGFPTIIASSAPFPKGFVSSVSSLVNSARPFTSAPWLSFTFQGDHAILAGTPPTNASSLVIYLASVVPNSLPAFQTLTIGSNPQTVVTGSNIVTAPPTPPGSTSPVTVTLPISVTPITTITQTPIVVPSPLIITGDQLTLPPPPGGGLSPVTLYVTPTGTLCVEPNTTSPAVSNSSKVVAPSVHLTSAARPETSGASGTADLVPFATFFIEFDQAPSIITPAETYFSEGVANTYNVATSGFPQASPVTDSHSTATAMRVKLTGTLPSGVTFTDQSPGGLPTGTGLISGRPTETGTFPVTIVANNGVGKPATQQLTIVVNKAGDVNGDGVVSCADVAIVKAAFGASLGQANYNARADLNHDFTVNVLDLAFVAAHLPPGTRCQ